VSRLSIELVPSTAWWSNVRSNVSRADWEKCKRFVRARSGDRCEVCGGRGRRWPVECHEIWHYDDENEIQTLVGLIALCPSCHEVKHIGRAMAMGNLERAIDHLCRVNGWQPEHAGTYIDAPVEARHQLPRDAGHQRDRDRPNPATRLNLRALPALRARGGPFFCFSRTRYA
jgi:hypothetical protein